MSSIKMPRIWIVDDDEDDQFLFEAAFRQLIPPVLVRLLADGEELLPALASTDTLPDLIILDLNMPRLNGFEALKLLRSHQSYQDLAVVVLSTSSLPEDQEKALELGANGFLTKPPTLDHILTIFGQLVEQWQLN
ncbi:response regulator [Spirosoma koreense]